MKDLVRDTDFTTLKNNFDELCDEINRGSEAVALSLSSGRKVFIVPEKNYDSITHIMVHTSENACIE